MAGSSLSLIFLVLLLAALRFDLDKVSGAAERRFWNCLSAAFGSWLAGSLLTLAPLPEIMLLIGEEAFYAVYYMSFVMALEEQPHLRSRLRPKRGLLNWPAFAILVLGLFAYFVMIPLLANRPEYDSALPSTFLYLILDALIVVRLLYLGRRAELRWRVLYHLLALGSVLLFLDDLVNLLYYTVWIDRPWQQLEALLWYSQFVPLVLAARLRQQPFGPAPTGSGRRRDLLAEARESTLVVALVFPCIHFAFYTLGYPDLPSKQPRDLLMLVWLCLLGTVAWFQHRGLERRHSYLDEGTAAMSAELAWRETMTREREQLIAEIRSHNRELEARNAEMESLNYSLSHDLRSPLISIRGFLGVLRTELASDGLSAPKTTLRRIQGAADHMGQMLEQVLDLSRIGRVEGSPEALELAELAREAAAEVLRRRSSTDATTTCPAIEVDTSLPSVSGHRQRLVEAMIELLDNAARYMGSQPDPKIEVGFRRAGDGVVFEVRDNGPGIGERYREQIFELFNQLDPRAEGTGIGLTRVRKIIELHGGQIWVEPGGSERGSTFCFTLPLAAHNSLPARVAAPEAVPEGLGD